MAQVDPVSKNEVPPGAAPEEVRDNIDAKLSENEYVIPADVVRFIGLDKIEKLVSQAKEGLAQMAKDGRIGGEPVEEEDDLPFSDEELMQGQDELAMASGGLVKPVGDQIIDNVYGGNNTAVMPPWMQDEPTTPLQSDEKNRPQEREPTSTMAGSVDKWKATDFTNAVKQRSDLGTQVIETGISKMMPFGGAVLKARNRYLDRQVPGAIDAMLKSGVDIDGTPLTEQQIADLQKAKNDFVNTKGYNPGLGGQVIDKVKGLISKKEPKKTTPEKTTEEKPKTKTDEKPKDSSSKSKDDKEEKDKSREDRR